MNIKPNGSNLIRLFLSIILLLFVVTFHTACFAGLSDWEYDLPNSYQIVRVNSQTIVFGKSEDIFNQTIDRQILAFCYGETYVGIKQLPLGEMASGSFLTSTTMMLTT